MTWRTASSTILPLLVRGMSATWTICAGTCRGDVSRANPFAIRRRSSSSSTTPSRQPDEQHDALVAFPLLPHRQALEHFRQLLDLAVDLRGADAHAAGIERGIRPAVDDEAAVLRPPNPVAVAPDARESVRSTPRDTWRRPGSFQKPTGIDGNGALQTSSPALARSARPSRRRRPRPCRAPAHLNLAAPDRRVRVAADKAAHDVRAAGDRRQMHVRS